MNDRDPEIAGDREEAKGGAKRAGEQRLGKHRRPLRIDFAGEEEELISPHPGIGGILADPCKASDRRGGR